MKIKNWLSKHYRIATLSIVITLMVAMLATMCVPAFADVTYLDIDGTYTINAKVRATYMDGTLHPQIKGTYTMTLDNTNAAVTGTLTWLGNDLTLAGLVGSGSRPNIALGGIDSDGTIVSFAGRVTSSGGVVSGISGHIQGYCTSDGDRWDDSANGTAAVSTAAAYSGVQSCLLTAGTLTNPEDIILHQPYNKFKLSSMDTLVDSVKNGISFYYNLQDTKTPGPQIMLRFAPKGSTDMTYYSNTTGHVDITIMPYQGTTGDGTWKKCTITSASAICGYYGNDPTDYTAFDGGFTGENYTLAEIEAAIDAEAAMIAGGDTCGDWVLTMVAIELWEGGARTCYIDDIQVGSTVYYLEAELITANFKARIVE